MNKIDRLEKHIKKRKVLMDLYFLISLVLMFIGMVYGLIDIRYGGIIIAIGIGYFLIALIINDETNIDNTTYHLIKLKDNLTKK